MSSCPVRHEGGASGHEGPPAPPGAPRRGGYPPGPSFLRYAWLYVREGCSFLRLAARLLRTYGDIVHVQVGSRHHIYINQPEANEQIMLAGYAMRTSRPATLRHAVGQGLITSQGELHRKMRGLIQPFFLRPALADKSAMIVEQNIHMLSRWREGETRDMAEEMTHLTLHIITRTLFGTAYTDEDMVRRIGRATQILHQYGNQSPMSYLNMRIETLPGLGRLAFTAGARQFLDDLIYGQMHERRAARQYDGPDLLSALLRAQAAQPEFRELTDRHIRDEMLTLFAAGHETTASALAWTWYLLSQHPEVERRFHEELDRVLEGRWPKHDDVPNLRYTRMVLLESMRLYPPVWTLGRRPEREGYQVGGYRIPRKSMIVISPFITQRDARFFPDPERFDPQRFTPAEEAKRPRGTYFPFAGGNRRCIGEPLAMTEAMLTLAAVGSRWRLRLVPGHRIEIEPFISLKPKYGVRMTLEQRPACAAASTSGMDAAGRRDAPAPRASDGAAG